MLISRNKYRLRLAVALVAASTFLPTSLGATSGPDNDHDGHRHKATKPARKPDSPRDPNRLWCGEHGLYEDQCFICHPELENRPADTGDDDHADRDHAGHDHGAANGDRGLWCNEHGVAEIECGICQPQLASALEPGQSLKVRLPSPASAEKAGIRTGQPRLSDTAASIKVFCEVRYNQNRLARVTPLTRGVIHSVHADVGDFVEAGELLIEIASSEVADAKRDLLVAIVRERMQQLAYEREKQLVAKEISAARNFQQAEADFLMAELNVSSARQRLINLGFTAEEVIEVERTKSSSSLVHVHAPFRGTLVERSAVVGEAAVPGTPLFTLADLDVMWLNLLIPESRLAGVRVGLPVDATFTTLPGFTATGKIDWVSTSITEPSRMVEARAVVSNNEKMLRSNLFGEARIALSANVQRLRCSASRETRLFLSSSKKTSTNCVASTPASSKTAAFRSSMGWNSATTSLCPAASL